VWKQLVRGVIGGLVALAVIYAVGAAFLLFGLRDAMTPALALGVFGAAVIVGIHTMSRLGKSDRGSRNSTGGEPPNDPPT
jgi:hypothetical protein